MASPLARSAGSLVVLAVFAACGGVTDPHLFGPSNNAGASGTLSHGGASPAGGDSARAGADKGGTSSSGGTAAAGADSTEAGATDGGSANAGSSNAGVGGVAQAGTGGSAGASRGGNGGNAGGGGKGGSAGSSPNAGSGGSDGETCQTLLAKANQQLAAAQVCSLAADAMQCTGTVKNPCNCEVPVNRKESAETKTYEATLAALEKKHCVQACLALVCFPASHANCLASAIGSAAGSCVAGVATPL